MEIIKQQIEPRFLRALATVQALMLGGSSEYEAISIVKSRLAGERDAMNETPRRSFYFKRVKGKRSASLKSRSNRRKGAR
jgi:hypothetical protein